MPTRGGSSRLTALDQVSRNARLSTTTIIITIKILIIFLSTDASSGIGSVGYYVNKNNDHYYVRNPGCEARTFLVTT